MEEKELLEKNRFTKEEYEKKVKEQFRQMIENNLKKQQEEKKNSGGNKKCLIGAKGL